MMVLLSVVGEAECWSSNDIEQQQRFAQFSDERFRLHAALAYIEEILAEAAGGASTINRR